MRADGPRLSLVIPAHDEARVIGQVVRGALAEVAGRLPGTEVLVVDDGSTDGTREAALGAGATACLRLERNLGQGPALCRGFDAGHGEWICHMDGDGQVLAEDFWTLWALRDEADLVLGVRRVRRDPLHRRVLTRGVRGAVRLAAGRPLEDAATPMRLMRRTTWEDVRPDVQDACALSVLVSVAAARRGWRVAEVPVRHLPRPHGASRLRGLRLARFTARGTLELAALVKRLRDRDVAERAASAGP